MKKITSKKMKKAVITVLKEGEMSWGRLIAAYGGTVEQWEKIFPFRCCGCTITASDIEVYYYSTDIQFIREVGDTVSVETAIMLMRKHLDINYLREVANKVNKKNYMWNRIFANNEKFFSNPVIFREFRHFLGNYQEQYWNSFINN